MKQLADKEDKHRDKIGFLPIKHKLEFEGGSFTPLPNFDEARRFIDKWKNRDGFIYPPLIETKRKLSQPNKPENIVWESIPNTERPALLYKLPASHELVIINDPIDDDFRKSDGAFLMHLASYLFGVRLQFYDWWFDSRAPTESTHIISITQQKESDFFSHSYRAWKQWPRDLRIRFTNILYVNSKVPSYEWDWEQFTISYMVFDALYELANAYFGVEEKIHKKRLYRMCEYFGLACENDNLDKISNIRNNLFHECCWYETRNSKREIQSDQKDIRLGRPFDAGFFQSQNLWRLNQRLIPAILGYKTEYIASPWWYMGPFRF